MSLWSAAKAKVQLRLSVQRLRTLQQKKEAQAKAARRDIATLLERRKFETARIKVEGIINEDVYVELLELLELYCELLLARFGLLDQSARTPDPGIYEGVCSIIHAAPRTELKELHIVRDILMHKYGREFSAAVMENRDGCVSERVMSKLDLATPSAALVDAYIGEIAKAYGVPWKPEAQESQDDDSAEGGVKEKAEEGSEKPDHPADDTTETKASKGPTLPSVPSSQAKTSPPPPSEEDEFELLSKRFADLKKR
ncbi:DUF292-domain-containing protein [Coprinopsis marcescibilis]|uniref:DUF292-domain-containing protein n=1 Tax=Coprinopsis marcescibilis TaxID=230819 RepID=A0A5C3L192_COPMA|nr:DUF292-domain-containing protein [Coprinopsis marcescibilis]